MMFSCISSPTDPDFSCLHKTFQVKALVRYCKQKLMNAQVSDVTIQSQVHTFLQIWISASPLDIMSSVLIFYNDKRAIA